MLPFNLENKLERSSAGDEARTSLTKLNVFLASCTLTVCLSDVPKMCESRVAKDAKLVSGTATLDCI